MLYKKGVLINFIFFKEKHLCWILRPATLFKKDPSAALFRWDFWSYQEHFFIKYLRVTAFKHYFVEWAVWFSPRGIKDLSIILQIPRFTNSSRQLLVQIMETTEWCVKLAQTWQSHQKDGRCSDLFITNFENISHIVLVFPLLIFWDADHDHDCEEESKICFSQNALHFFCDGGFVQLQLLMFQ